MNETLLVLAPLRLERLALGGHDGVRTLHTGMGRERSRRGARIALASNAPAIAVAGLCAGIAPELRAGDVVCATQLLPDGGEPISLPGAALLAAGLRRRGLRVHLGPLASSPRIEGPRERRARAGAALALDMESAWLAAGAGGRPLAVARVVVDVDGRRLADPRTLVAGARALRSLRVTGAALAEWAAAVAPGPAPAAGRPSDAGAEPTTDPEPLGLLPKERSRA